MKKVLLCFGLLLISTGCLKSQTLGSDKNERLGMAIIAPEINVHQREQMVRMFQIRFEQEGLHTVRLQNNSDTIPYLYVVVRPIWMQRLVQQPIVSGTYIRRQLRPTNNSAVVYDLFISLKSGSGPMSVPRSSVNDIRDYNAAILNGVVDSEWSMTMNGVEAKNDFILADEVLRVFVQYTGYKQSRLDERDSDKK
jgi:hypothetical protein